VGRTQRAIQSRLELRGIKLRPGRGIARPIPASLVKGNMTVRIAKADVPTFYEQGWRLVSFTGDLCIFEWPHADAPVMLAERLAA